MMLLALAVLVMNGTATANATEEELVAGTYLLAYATIAVAVVTALVALIFGLRSEKVQKSLGVVQAKQLESMEKLNGLSAMLKVFELLNTVENRQLRRFVFDVEFSKAAAPKDYERIKEQVRGLFAQIGYLSRAEMIPFDIYMQSHADVTIKVWRALKKDLEEERKKRTQPSFQDSFEWLGTEAEQYWKKEYPDADIAIY